MKSKFKKRIIAGMLCMVMVLSGSMSALAEDENAESAKNTNKIEGVQDTSKTEEPTETTPETTTPPTTGTSGVQDSSSVEGNDVAAQTPQAPAAYEATYENEKVVIKATAASGVVPEGAELSVTPIEKKEITSDMTAEEKAEAEDMNKQHEATEKKLKEESAKKDNTLEGFLAYDICLLVNGQEVEPNGDVKVTMEYKKAAAPEGLDEKTAKDAEVSVMHLEENADGTVKEVVDMADKNKVEAVKTTDANKIQKAEFKTDSFSTFTITWQYREFDITVNYVDKDGNPIEGPQKEEVAFTDYNQSINLMNYAKAINGYKNPSIHVDEIQGTKINWIKSFRTGDWSDRVYSIRTGLEDYVNNASWSAWLSSNDSKEGSIYIVYERTDLYIRDDILQSGNLVAEYNGASEATVKEYIWYRSDNQTGDYKKVERIAYEGGNSNISEDGTSLSPALDEGARKWYKVEVTLSNGEKVISDPFQVPYYNELQNGGFETPNNSANPQGSGAFEWRESDYLKNGGVWQTTGTAESEGSGKTNEIEIINPKASSWVMEDKGFMKGVDKSAAEKEQFAEINAASSGALYQDVLTVPGETLNWWLAHRARSEDSYKTEVDTMYLVIMPTQTALTAANGEELKTQAQLKNYLNSLQSGMIEDGTETATANAEKLLYNVGGIYVYKVTSTDKSWHKVSQLNAYTATASATRFFFMAGKTSSGNPTVGNFVDEVGFSQDLPPVSDDEFTLQIEKKFKGLDGNGIENVTNNIQFKLSAKADGKELSDDELQKLFGKTILTKNDLTPAPDGTLSYTLMNQKIGRDKTYEVTITELNAELDGYELITNAETTVTFDGKDEVTEGSVINELKGKTTAKVVFTNTYDRADYKKVDFTKVWDDKNNEFNTRPNSLDVTLKASIVVNEGGNAKEIQLTKKQLGVDNLTATLTADGNWKAQWDVPVYYTYNNVKVKINYTVVEGSIDSDYVYEPANGGAAQSGNGSDYEKKTFANVTNPVADNQAETQQASKSLTSRKASLARAAAAEPLAEESELGEPAHKKYIEYNESTGDYTLNLDVTGAKGEAQGADILFVIDTSGSMGSRNNNLLNPLKALLTTDETGIIDRIFAAEGNVNSVAYVSFAGKNETTVSNWYQTSGKETLKTRINGLRATGGTNWTYAMQQASSLLAQKSSSKNEKVVIFLSDGKPTYTINKYGNQSGEGNRTEDSYYTDAANVVKNSTSLSAAKLYSVYLTSGTKDGMEIFKDRVGDSAELVDGTDLQSALDDILNKVIPTYKNVTITDTLSENVVFVEGTPTITVKKKTSNGVVTTLDSSQYKATVEGNKVTVGLLNGDSLEDGSTYTMSFRVKPSEKANQKYSNGGYTDTGEAGTGSTSAGKEGFYSNNDAQTTVSYTVNDTEGTANYPMPVVQVTMHELSYDKTWIKPSDIDIPDGDVVLDVVYTDGTTETVTLNKANKYHYTEKVPVTKNISSVTEREIDGYTPSYNIKDGVQATVTNSYSKVTTKNINVKKEWVGGTSRNPISVSLYRSKNDGQAEVYKTVTLSDTNNGSITNFVGFPIPLVALSAHIE